MSATIFDHLVILGQEPLSKRFQLTTQHDCDIKVESYQELTAKLSECHSPIRLVIFERMLLTDEELNFVSSVDPIIFTGEIFMNHLDFSSKSDLFKDWFGKIMKPTLMQFKGIKGLSHFSTYLTTLPGLHQADNIKVLESDCKESENLVLKELLSSCTIEHLAEVLGQDVVNQLFERFKVDIHPVSYILMISKCPDLPDSLTDRIVSKKGTNENWVVKFKPTDSGPESYHQPHVKYELISGYRLAIIRQGKHEQSIAEAI
uniref:Uncharacterized protein n=1 Tax=Ditylenchus dipsaci TaxID=166011 RepID=A0A915D4X8_9BILA